MESFEAEKENINEKENAYTQRWAATGVLTKNQIAARHVFKELPEFHGRPKD